MINPRAICLEAISNVSNFKSNFTKAICDTKNVNLIAPMIDSFVAICNNYDDLAYLYTMYNDKVEDAIYHVGDCLSFWLEMSSGDPLHYNWSKALKTISEKYAHKEGEVYSIDIIDAVNTVNDYFEAFNTLMGMTK